MELSRVYKYEKHLFMYDKEDAIVYLVAKMGPEERKTNEEWLASHNRPLFQTDPSGNYMLLDGVGLRRENWRNKEARDGYLAEWCFELDEELAYMMDDLAREFK